MSLNPHREINDLGFRCIKQWEGLRLKPYRDQAGHWTDGYGNTHGVIPFGPLISMTKADADLMANLAPAEQSVDHLVNVPLTDNQFAALVSFAFNEGTAAFAASTLLKVLNAGHYDQVPAQLARWVNIHVDGALVHDQGLVNRRANEINLWNTP